MARAPARWHHCLGRRLAAVLACTLGSPAGGQPDLYQDEYDCYREFAQCTERWSPAHKRYCFHLLGVLCMDVSNPDQDPDKFFTGESNEPPGDSLSVDHGRGHEAPEFVTITNTRTTITTTQAFATTTTRATSRAGPWATTRLATTVTTTVPTTTTPQTTQAHPLKLLPKHRIYEPKGEKQQLSRDPWTADAEAMKHCGERFTAPQPNGATDLNGIFLTPVCFTKEGGNHHIFVIGDWGGISQREGMVPVPADHRSPKFPPHRRPFVLGADNCAQLNVAEQMMIKAERSRPDYIINCGDNFYWGGIQDNCGTPVTGCRDHRGQWERVFERIYRGPGLESIQWLGVLGNHDYGGWTFANGWDQTISYTWAKGGASTGRWFTPAQYWGQQVRYREFSIDWFFVDSNVFNAFDPSAAHNHNICSNENNPKNATCGEMGPMDIKDCPFWFQRLWEAQVAWLEKGLKLSIATWQIVVTHFPPELGEHIWRRLAYEHGIDLLVTAHRHQQEVHHGPEENFLSPTAYIVTGGGGGITSESMPSWSGNDDQYGFMDLTLSKEEIVVESISHGGALRKRVCVARRLPRSDRSEPVDKSLCREGDDRPVPAPPRKHLVNGRYTAPDTSFFFEAAKRSR